MIAVTRAKDVDHPGRPVQRRDTKDQHWFFVGAPHIVTAVSSGMIIGTVVESYVEYASAFSVPPIWHFDRLVQKWREERGATSSITAMAMCPSYQRIIAMGEKVVPLILHELEEEGDEPDMWFWALKAITGADPVADEDRGDMKAMADAWLAWGGTRYAR